VWLDALVGLGGAGLFFIKALASKHSTCEVCLDKERVRSCSPHRILRRTGCCLARLTEARCSRWEGCSTT